MKTLGVLACISTIWLALATAPQARANNAGAVVLVNSQSARYLDYVHLPAVSGQFRGARHSAGHCLERGTSDLTNYALIMIGYAQLDMIRTY